MHAVNEMVVIFLNKAAVGTNKKPEKIGYVTTLT